MSWFTSMFKKDKPQGQDQTGQHLSNNKQQQNDHKVNNGWGTQAQQSWGTQAQQGWGTQAISEHQGWGTQQVQQGWGTQAQTYAQQEWNSKPSADLVTSLDSISPYSEYTILSALSMEQALSIEQGSNKTILWKNEGSNNQKFRFIPADANKYRIQVMSGGMLEVPNGATAAGVQLFIGQPSNAPHQLWSILPVQGIPNSFLIKSFCGKCLDVREQKSDNGTSVIHYNIKKKNNKNQAWYFHRVNFPGQDATKWGA